ncbi:hypothetical protein [Pseudomonas aeruginosa]|uniref:hypothetical protein n=1 Tax=Pseudomonas aeruginosa TaxID=287 RepID=UPI001869B051|nr:hypothetical protein [Pseudomonas aeruginosa]HBO3178473.1 hypothetical protein [Pseudomonas aeruginosa]HEN8625876.1 hypothetical protein [Pseudomonas aeruginosa]HEN8630593.1 hypothetical protein [Pseudomonas aeruginosa]HEN8809034.1 hypothetical protein [Pseudomonas aeruginosa]HEN8821446.1 hypothetical protein [Pseudomonas aeruginosa]
MTSIPFFMGSTRHSVRESAHDKTSIAMIGAQITIGLVEQPQWLAHQARNGR